METFVVRVFIPADAGDVSFCGVVEHVGTGRTEPFQGTRALICFVFGELARLTTHSSIEFQPERGEVEL